MLFIEIAFLIVIFMQFISLYVDAFAIFADSSSWLLFGIEILGDLLYLFAMYKLSKLFPGDLRRACYSMAVLVVLYCLVFFMPAGFVTMQLISFIAIIDAIARLLCFYYVLTAFSEISAGMQNEMMARAFLMGRFMYMIVSILSTGALFGLGETLASVVSVVSGGVTVYILLLYARMRKELSAYKEPEEIESQ